MISGFYVLLVSFLLSLHYVDTSLLIEKLAFSRDNDTPLAMDMTARVDWPCFESPNGRMWARTLKNPLPSNNDIWDVLILLFFEPPHRIMLGLAVGYLEVSMVVNSCSKHHISRESNFQRHQTEKNARKKWRLI